MMPPPYVLTPTTGETLPRSRAQIAAEAVKHALDAIGSGHLFQQGMPRAEMDDRGEPIVNLGCITPEEAGQLAALLRGLSHPPPTRGSQGAAGC